MQVKETVTADIAERGVVASSSSDNEHDNAEQYSLSPEEQRQVLRKIDIRVCVVLGIINCISLIDRSNMAAAAVAGMFKDLKLGIDNRYSIAALVFFVPYVFFEFPSTLIARWSGTRRLLMLMCMLWGLVMIGTGFVKRWEELAGLRALLGVFESASAPVMIHLLSAWYTRYEVQKRYAIYFIVSICVSSFSGILAYGFLQMSGVGGLSGWRWTFIWEGVMTVLVGVIAGSFVVDFPDKVQSSSRFLTHRQITWVMTRLREDRGDADSEPFLLRKFLEGARHFSVWLFAMIFCCCTTIAYCVGFFLPIILRKDLGFDVGTSLCLAAPPYLFPAIMIYGSGWLGDKYRIRGPILLVNAVITIVGLVLLGWARPSGVRYFSLFIINGGVLANIPATMAYQANNIRGQWVRAFGSATFVVGGALGGIFGALMFGNGDPAAVKRGICGCIAVNIAIIVIVLVLTLFFTHQNRLAREGKKIIFGYPGFLYSV